MECDLRKNQQCLDAGIKLLRVKDSEYEKHLGGNPAATIKRVLDWLASA